MMGALRIIFEILFVYYVFKFLVRLLFPAALNYTMRKAQEHVQNQQPPKKEGEVKIEHIPDKNKIKDDDRGEYIDYEEVK